MIEQKLSGLRINLETMEVAIDFSGQEGLRLLFCLITGMKIGDRKIQAQFLQEMVENRSKILEMQRAMTDASKEDAEDDGEVYH